MKDDGRTASQSDVAWIYKLVLGREHENEDRLTERAGRPVAKLLGDFFQSREFTSSVSEPLAAGVPIEETRGDLPPGLADWIKATLALEPASMSALGNVDSWSALYSVLFSDPLFSDAVNTAGRIFDVDALRLLSTMAEEPERFMRVGAIDEIMAGGVRGWSVNPRTPDRMSTAELWVDDAFIAAAPADRFRRDVQDRFGGQGRAGFFIETPHGLPEDRAHRLEVRDGPSGRVLQRLERAARPASPTSAQQLKAELEAVRGALAKIEARLAAEDRNDFYDPQAYSAYYEAAYRQTSPAHPVARSDDPTVTVAVDVEGADPVAMEEALLALAAQVGGVRWKRRRRRIGAQRFQEGDRRHDAFAGTQDGAVFRRPSAHHGGRVVGQARIGGARQIGDQQDQGRRRPQQGFQDGAPGWATRTGKARRIHTRPLVCGGSAEAKAGGAMIS